MWALTLCILSQAMAEQLAENYHNTWGRKKKQELEAKGEAPTPRRTDSPSPYSPSHRLRSRKGLGYSCVTLNSCFHPTEPSFLCLYNGDNRSIYSCRAVVRM